MNSNSTSTVKLHVLARGKTNIHGAYEYNDESDIQAKNILIMVGSNDLSQSRSPETTVKHFSSIKELVNKKYPNTTLHMFPLFHRLNEERFSQDVDLVNTKLQLIICKTVSLVKHDNINSRNHHLMEYTYPAVEILNLCEQYNLI